MDAIDNLIYATRNTSVYPPGGTNPPAGVLVNALDSDFLPGIPAFTLAQYPTVTVNGVSSYSQQDRENFVTLQDTNIIEDAMRKHWFDVANRVSYTSTIAQVPPLGAGINAFVEFGFPPYHLIFSYLVENTRIAQIFEKMIWMYQHDEKLLKANSIQAFQWIMNTEDLFYKDFPGSNRNIVSYIRPISEASRRNAYQRMFGMDLAFGDLSNKDMPYVKAEFSNSSFITLFESFLIEIWQGHTNANNTSGRNTTDLPHMAEIAGNLQEMLMQRRTSQLNFNNYQFYNLSREEFSSFVFMYWLFYAIASNTALVNFLNCNANTPGDRLINIGKKVGLPAHSKSVALLDIALPMNAILRLVEIGFFNAPNQIDRILRSRSAINPVLNVTAQEIAIMDNLLLILNNWERATGHRIKNPEANITGTVRVQQNGSPARQKVVMN